MLTVKLSEVNFFNAWVLAFIKHEHFIIQVHFPIECVDGVSDYLPGVVQYFGTVDGIGLFIDQQVNRMKWFCFINGRHFNFLQLLLIDILRAIQLIKKILIVKIGK